MSDENSTADSSAAAVGYAAHLKREADALERTADDLAEHGYFSEAMEYRALASTVRTMAERAA